MQGAAVSLRGGREGKGERAMFSLRLPRDLLSYVRETAKSPGRDMTEVICSAIALDRDLAQELSGDRKRLQDVADQLGLRMNEDLPIILALLVRRGLDAESKPSRKP